MQPGDKVQIVLDEEGRKSNNGQFHGVHGTIVEQNTNYPDAWNIQLDNRKVCVFGKNLRLVAAYCSCSKEAVWVTGCKCGAFEREMKVKYGTENQGA